MPIDPTAIIQSNLQAAIDLLSGKKKLKDGLFFCGGDPMNREQRFSLAATAIAHDMDVIHFEFTKVAGCYLTGINVIVPRDGRCLVASGCQLYLPRGSQRARIVPKPEVRGYFTVLPGELLHHGDRPNDLEAGVQRAAKRLAQMA